MTMPVHPLLVRLAGIFVFLIIFLATLSAAQAQNPVGISATPNKQSYEPGDKVIISGTIQHVINNNPVTIIVRNPIGNVYDVGQVVMMKNLFVHDFILGDDAKPGIYMVNIRQGDQTTQIQFYVKASQSQVIPVLDSAIKVRGENTSLIRYENVDVSSIDNSITILVNTTKITSGHITEDYQIPKRVIDAPGSQLIIKENGVSVNCIQTETDSERILDCPIKAGTTEIKLIGTVVIPEFGGFAVVVLASTTAGIIIISRTKSLYKFR